jgi:hypothetical protein
MNEQDPFGHLPPINAPATTARPGEDPFERLRQAEFVERRRSQEAPKTPQTFGEHAADILGAGAAGVGRGIVSLPGIVGDIGQLYERSPAYAAWVQNRVQELRGKAQPGSARKAYEERLAPIEERMTPGERAGTEYRIAGVPIPTGQSMVNLAAGAVPSIKYEGKTPTSRVVGTVGEFVGQVPATSAVSMGVRGALGAPKAAGAGQAAVRELATTTGAGVTSGAAGEALRGTDDEAAARVLGVVPGMLAGRAIAGRTPAATAERSERIAGDIVRETDPDITRRQPMLDKTLEGVEPTSAQAYGSRMEALERAVPGGQQAARTQADQSRMIVERAAAAIPEEIQPGGVKDTTVNPMSMSSAEAQNLYRAIQEPARVAYEVAWKHPALTQSRYNSTAVKRAINGAFKEMGTARLSIDKDIMAQIDALRKYPGGQVPFADVQRLKADANAVLRDSTAKPSAVTAAKAISTQLDDMMTDIKAVSNIFMKGVTPAEVGPAFDNARTLAREYNNTFETPATKSLSEVHGRYHSEAGRPVIEPELFLSKVLGSPDEALAKYREIQNIPGVDVARPVGDWVVSKILGGKAFITPEMIANFRKNPGYDGLIREVPGLEARLDQIANTGLGNQIVMSLSDAVQRDPAKLADWIKNNRADINKFVTDPDGRAFIDRVNQSANILKKLPVNAALPQGAQQRLKLLSSGDMFTLLHGRAIGSFAGAAAGYGAGKALGMTIPAQIAFEALGAAAGATASQVMSPVTRFAARMVYGTTQEQAMAALQRAVVDPQFARFLAQKPSEANTLRLNAFLREMSARAPALGMAAERLPDEPAPPPKTTEEMYRELTIPLQRRGRATGGAVNLRELAKTAKNHVTSSTEKLLNEHDDTVAKALEVANKHI